MLFVCSSQSQWKAVFVGWSSLRQFAPLASAVYLSLSPGRDFFMVTLRHTALRGLVWMLMRVKQTLGSAVCESQFLSSRDLQLKKWACDPPWRLARAESFCRRLLQWNLSNGRRHDPTTRFQDQNLYPFWATSIFSFQGSVSWINIVRTLAHLLAAFFVSPWQ